MSAPFTPEQEARVREIAIEAAVAATRVQAQLSANREIDRVRVTEAEVRASIDWFQASRDPQQPTAPHGGSLDPQ